MRFPVGRSRIVHVVSLIYVAAPVAIFLGGYLRPYWSIPIFLVLMLSVARQAAGDSLAPAFERPAPPWFDASLFVMVTAFAVLAGIGGLAAQDGDYTKHNAVFKDLMELRWPLAYQETGADDQPRVLNTYVGYYLAAGLVGKVLGTHAGFAFSLLWAALGLYLAIWWFFALIGARSLWLAALFLLFGGVDLLGHVLLAGKWPAEPTHNFANWMHLFGSQPGGLFWIFPSNPGILANGPHHVLPCWIAILMMMHDALRRNSASRCLFLWASTAYVSAFFAIGMLPFLLCCVLGRRVRDLLTLENTLVFGLLAAVSVLYVASNDGRFTRGFLWDYANPFSVVNYLLLFYLTGIGLYLLFWPDVREREPAWRAWLAMSIACVLLFPLYRIGPMMEFPIKGLLPAVMVFLACFARSLAAAWSQGGWRSIKAAAVIAAIGCFSGVSLISWAASRGFSTAAYRNGFDETKRLNELARIDIGRQLFSDGDTFFWKHLATPVRYFQPDRFTIPTFLSATDTALLDARFPHGSLPPRGRDTGKAVGEAPVLTFEVLLRPRYRQTAPWAVIATSEDAGKGFAVQQFNEMTNKYYVGLAGTPAPLLSTPVAVAPNEVSYLVFSLTEGKLTTFVNGVVKSVDAVPAGFRTAASSVPVWVGNMKRGTRPFEGELFQFRVSARAMTEPEARAQWERIAHALSGS